jgi:long-chain fatty acid transport protein
LQADATISNAVDFGTIGAATLGTPTASVFGLFPQSSDGSLTVEGDDTALTWGTGALYKFGDNNEHKIGVNYRAPIFLKLSGSADFDVPDNAAILTSTGAFTDTGIREARVTLPEIISFGGVYGLSEDVDFLYGSSWTRWTRFSQLEIEFDNPAQPTSTEIYSWENSWKHAIGLGYQASEPLSLQLGFAFDQSPVRNAFSRAAKVPDSPAFWYSAGASYDFCDNLSTSLSYLYVHFQEGNTERLGPTGDYLNLGWENYYHAVSLTFTYKL